MARSKGRDTRDRLMRAAIKVFAAKGFQAATAQEICRRAKANMAAVNYYFGGKQGLYQAVLELMFHKFETVESPAQRAQTQGGAPQEQLRTYIETLFQRTYGVGGKYDPDLAAIMTMEMARPSPSLDRIVERFLTPDKSHFQEILAKIVGPKASEQALRDCACSICGQVLYYCCMWPIFIRVYPDHPGMQAKGVVEHLTEQVTLFSLAGLEAVRRALEAGTYPRSAGAQG